MTLKSKIQKLNYSTKYSTIVAKDLASSTGAIDIKFRIVSSSWRSALALYRDHGIVHNDNEERNFVLSPLRNWEPKGRRPYLYN